MTSSPVKRKLAAILSADAAGYSRHMGADEEQALRVLSALRAVVDSVIEFHDGRIVNTAGDSVLAEFASPVEAVRAAVEIQAALKTRNESLPEDRRMLFRIGVNLGDVMVKDGDLLGDGVNIAARLQSLAEPGGICVSGSIAEQIEGKLDLRLLAMGEPEMKNIDRPIRVFRIETGGTKAAAGASAQARRGARRPWAALGALAVLAAAAAGGWLIYAQIKSNAPAPATEPQRIAALTPPPLTRFDGAWRGDYRCAALRQHQAFTNTRTMNVQKGSAVFEGGTPDAPGWFRAEGLIRDNGHVVMSGKGISSLPENLGTTYTIFLNGRFEGDRFQAEGKLGTRDCALDLKRATAAAAPAKAPEQLAALMPPPLTRFDGIWRGEYRCGPFRQHPSFSVVRDVSVRNGIVVFESGTPSTPGWQRAEGRIRDDGRVVMEGTGISPLADSLGNVYSLAFTGRFEDERFVAEGKSGGRECTFDFKRAGR